MFTKMTITRRLIKQIIIVSRFSQEKNVDGVARIWSINGKCFIGGIIEVYVDVIDEFNNNDRTTVHS